MWHCWYNMHSTSIYLYWCTIMLPLKRVIIVRENILFTFKEYLEAILHHMASVLPQSLLLKHCGLVMPYGSWSSLVEIMACHLSDTQTLPKPILTYCQLEPSETKCGEIWLELQFSFRKLHVQNVSHFVPIPPQLHQPRLRLIEVLSGFGGEYRSWKESRNFDCSDSWQILPDSCVLT